MPLRFLARIGAVTGAVAAVAASATLLAAPASAASSAVEIDYHTTGSTTLANPNSKATVTFKPTTLQSFVTFKDDGTASIKAFLPLAPVTASFKAYGFLPAKGTVVFTQVGYVTGTLAPYDGTGFPLNATARYVVSLRDVTIGGAKANVGTNCQTINPITAKVSAEPGFNLVDGTLDGTYDLGKFFGCGQASDIINDTLPGKGNNLSLTIHFGDTSASSAQAIRSLAHNNRAAAA